MSKAVLSDFYWLEATETSDSTVHLFGVGRGADGSDFSSCCLQVTDVVPTAIVFIKPGAVLKDVTSLLHHQAAERGARVLSVEPTTRSYAFDPLARPQVNAPCVCVRFVRGGEGVMGDGRTESRRVSIFRPNPAVGVLAVVGGAQSSVERFLVSRGIMGPRWLHLGAKPSKSTPPKLRGGTQYSVSMRDVSVVPDPAPAAPKLRLMEVAAELDSSGQFRGVATRVREGVSMMNMAITAPISTVGAPATPVEVLNKLLQDFQKWNPDIVVGHMLESTVVEPTLTLGHKAGISGWTSLARFDGGRGFAGRVVCDIATVSKDLIRTPLRSHSLEDVYQAVVPGNSPPDPAEHPMDRGWKILESLNALPLCLSLAQVCGCMWRHTLAGSHVEQNDYMLSHAYHKRGYALPDPVSLQSSRGGDLRTSRNRARPAIDRDDTLDGHVADPDAMDVDGDDNDDSGEVPDPAENSNGSSSSGNSRSGSSSSSSNSDDISHSSRVQFKGGQVIAPVKGLHTKSIVAVLDFVGTYPSIIVAYQICHTTRCPQTFASAMSAAGVAVATPNPPPRSVLPDILTDLINRRGAIKAQLKDASPHDRTAFEAAQIALKLASNRLFGCLGYGGSRYFNPQLAAEITRRGRELLGVAVEAVKAQGFPILYGDSDSVMVDTRETDPDAATRVAERLLSAINARVPSPVRMALDHMFSAALFVNKKKYVALDARTDEFTAKGIDFVRRDRCALVSDACRQVASMLLHKASVSDIMNRIREARQEIVDLGTPVARFFTVACLKCDPGQYGHRGLLSAPHARAVFNLPVAVRPKAGDFVSYVYCHGVDEQFTPTQRVSISPAPEEIDREYYLERLATMLEQLLPTELGSTTVREALGLQAHQNTSKRVLRPADSAINLTQALASLTDRKLGSRGVLEQVLWEDWLRSAIPFAYRCEKCNTTTDIEVDNNPNLVDVCHQCKQPIPPTRACGQLRQFCDLSVQRNTLDWARAVVEIGRRPISTPLNKALDEVVRSIAHGVANTGSLKFTF